MHNNIHNRDMELNHRPEHNHDKSHEFFGYDMIKKNISNMNSKTMFFYLGVAMVLLGIILLIRNSNERKDSIVYVYHKNI